MKTMISSNGLKTYVYPFKVYCWRSIKSSIEQMLCRPCFKKLLHKGPKINNIQSDAMSDICDWNIFKSFKDSDGSPYFTVYGFWCFTFERYNGTLGKFHINNHSISIQVIWSLFLVLIVWWRKSWWHWSRTIGAKLFGCCRLLALHQIETIRGLDLQFSSCKHLSLQKRNCYVSRRS